MIQERDELGLGLEFELEEDEDSVSELFLECGGMNVPVGITGKPGRLDSGSARIN